MEQSIVEQQELNTVDAEQSILDQIIDNTQAIRRETDRDRVKNQLDQFLSEVTSGSLVVSGDLINSIEVRIAAIDALMSEQLSKVLHHSEFQQLESSWTGLKGLLDQSETDNTQIRMLNATKTDLIKDFKSSSDFDQSMLFKNVYEYEYGTFGGEPYSALVGDFDFDNSPEDLYLLEQISHVAAAAHAPFLSSANAGMLGLNEFSELPRPRDMSKLFETSDYLRWKRFRESDDSRYVGLTLPRFIGRLPYGAKTIPVEQFCFEEQVKEEDSNSYLWVNAAYALAGRMVSAFEQHGWCAAIRGVESGGLVEALPTHHYVSISGEKRFQCPTEVAITDRREKELAELGFIPLVYYKGTDYAAFFSVQSPSRPRKYNSDLANSNAKLSTQLQYIMTTSRFAHYLKMIARDKVGSFGSRAECQAYLQSWINQYIVGSDTVGAKIKASHPLREARVDIVEVPGSPGTFRAVAYLRPHFQLEGLSMSLRLVAELPPSSAA